MKRWTILVLACALILGTGVGLIHAEAKSKDNDFAPAVITETKTFEQYEKAVADKTDVLIFSVDDNGNAAFEGKNDVTVASMMRNFRNIIPAIRVSSAAQADKVSQILHDENSDEFFVVSQDGQLINKIKRRYPRVRGVLDVTQRKDINESNAYDLTTEVAKFDCQVVLVNHTVSQETVYKIQAKSILVWGAADNEAADIVNVTLKGCYGVVSSDAEVAKAALTVFDKNTFFRPSYIVGHRGYPKKFNENSLEAVEGAYSAGATHAEIDIHLSADNKIIVMHDGTLDRTTDGTGEISGMNSEEILKHKIDINAGMVGLSKIPVLSEMFDILKKPEFSEKILIVEFKSDNPNIVTEVQKLIETYPEIRSRIMFIAFSRPTLTRLYNAMPDITRGFLGTVNSANFRDVLSPINAFIDSSTSAPIAEKGCTDIAKNYGYSIWTWTYDAIGNALEGITKGHSGLTMNNAGDIGKYIKYIKAPETVTEQDKTDGVTLKAICYDGTEKDVDATWVEVDEANGMFVYEFEDADYFYYKGSCYSQLVGAKAEENKQEQEQQQGGDTNQPGTDSDNGTEEKSGCGSSVSGLSLLGTVLLLGVTTVSICKKRGIK